MKCPRMRTIYVFCGSGMRSMIAASYLQRQGWQDLAVVLGGCSRLEIEEMSIEKVRNPF